MNQADVELAGFRVELRTAVVLTQRLARPVGVLELLVDQLVQVVAELVEDDLLGEVRIEAVVEGAQVVVAHEHEVRERAPSHATAAEELGPVRVEVDR